MSEGLLHLIEAEDARSADCACLGLRCGGAVVHGLSGCLASSCSERTSWLRTTSGAAKKEQEAKKTIQLLHIGGKSPPPDMRYIRYIWERCVGDLKEGQQGHTLLPRIWI
jgi:hypothetical protein